MQSILKISFQIISLILILSISFLSSETFAQNGLRIFEDIGGGSNTTTQTDDSNDNTALYVVGGLVVAGILVYALVINKDKKVPKDTTTTESNLKLSDVSGIGFDAEVQKVKDKIPVDLFMGIRNNKAIVNDKTYLLGVRVKL